MNFMNVTADVDHARVLTRNDGSNDILLVFGGGYVNLAPDDARGLADMIYSTLDTAAEKVTA